VSRTAHAGFVLDAFKQSIHDQRPAHRGELIHSDRGSQYVPIKYTERLAEAGIEPSLGSVGGSYDNALAGTINGPYKAEVIHRRGPWRSSSGIRHARMDRLVQRPPAARAYPQHPACRGLRTLLRNAGRHAYGYII
jgi:putative transposase